MTRPIPKAYAVAAYFGNEQDGFIACIPWIAYQPEQAAGAVISQVMADLGTRLPLTGVRAQELPREWLEKALAAMDEAEKAVEDEKPKVVQLVSDNLETHVRNMLNQGQQGEVPRGIAAIKHSPLCPGRFGMFCTCGANARACETIWPGDGAA